MSVSKSERELLLKKFTLIQERIETAVSVVDFKHLSFDDLNTLRSIADTIQCSAGEIYRESGRLMQQHFNDDD